MVPRAAAPTSTSRRDAPSTTTFAAFVSSNPPGARSGGATSTAHGSRRAYDQDDARPQRPNADRDVDRTDDFHRRDAGHGDVRLAFFFQAEDGIRDVDGRRPR